MATIEQTPVPSTGSGAGSGALVPAETGHDDHGGHDTHTGVANAKLGMWLFLSSDCLFFGAFISAYLFYSGRSQPGPHPIDVYNIPFTSVTSFILLMSSLTMVLALAAIQRGDHRRFRIWTVSTALFGAIFIAGQIYEFTEFYREGLALKTSVFGSSFASGVESRKASMPPRFSTVRRPPVDRRRRIRLLSRSDTKVT